MNKKEAKEIAISKAIDTLYELHSCTDYGLSSITDIRKVDKELAGIYDNLMKRLEKLRTVK